MDRAQGPVVTLPMVWRNPIASTLRAEAPPGSYREGTAPDGSFFASWLSDGRHHSLQERADGWLSHTIHSPTAGDGSHDVAIESYDPSGRWAGTTHGKMNHQLQWLRSPGWQPAGSGKPGDGSPVGPAKPKDPASDGSSASTGGASAKPQGSQGASSSSRGGSEKPQASDKPAEKPAEKPQAEKPSDSSSVAADAKNVAADGKKSLGGVVHGPTGGGPGGDPGEAGNTLTGDWDPRFGPAPPQIAIGVTPEDLVGDPRDRGEDTASGRPSGDVRTMGPNQVLPGKDSSQQVGPGPRLWVGDLATDPVPDDLVGNPPGED